MSQTKGMITEAPALNVLTSKRITVAGHWFVVSAVGVLGITGLAKVWSAWGQSRILAMTDPVTGISLGNLMLAVGVLEILIASICPFVKSQRLKHGLIAWLATNFVVYRLGLLWAGWKKPCICFGNLTDSLPISPQLADNILKGVLAYLLIGSYGLLIWDWRKARSGGSEDGKWKLNDEGQVL